MCMDTYMHASTHENTHICNHAQICRQTYMHACKHDHIHTILHAMLHIILHTVMHMLPCDICVFGIRPSPSLSIYGNRGCAQDQLRSSKDRVRAIVDVILVLVVFVTHARTHARTHTHTHAQGRIVPLV